MNNHYEILISISLGDNFPLQDEFLSKDCKSFAILEAKFTEEVLQSDPIEIHSANPELATELGFRLNKKDFHQFRTERKSIKLQCYVEYSTLPERHFIGYVVLHLRDAQEYSPEPKYKWNVLLNPKYKGSSTKRPQLYMAFMVNKLNDGGGGGSADGGGGGEQSLSNSMSDSQLAGSVISGSSMIESQFTRPMAKREVDSIFTNINSSSSLGAVSSTLASAASAAAAPTTTSTSSFHEDDLDANLKVKYRNKIFYIWDENQCGECDCNQMYLIHLQIDKPRNLHNLFNHEEKNQPTSPLLARSPTSPSPSSSVITPSPPPPSLSSRLSSSPIPLYYFKYTLFGRTIRSSQFANLSQCDDFRKHKFLFPIATYDKKMLNNYFESYPTVEVQLCAGDDRKIIGFFTINLLRLFENKCSTIEGDYMIVPEDESVYVKEPFPVVNLNLVISSKHHSKVLANILHGPTGGVEHHHSTPTQSRQSPQDNSGSNSITGVCSNHNQNAELILSGGEPAAIYEVAAAHHHHSTGGNGNGGSGGSAINHYYIAIDLRSIKLSSLNGDSCQILYQPFYLQFSYAFFGITDYIKTYPPIRFTPGDPDASITVPHGFCGFNFATTAEKLHFTFTDIPFIVQLLLEHDDTLLGTAEIDLSYLLRKQNQLPFSGGGGGGGASGGDEEFGDNFINTHVPVLDELNDQICQLQVVMFLQEIQHHLSTYPHGTQSEIKDIGSSLPPTLEDEARKSELISNLNDMIIETAHDIELWKEEQMKLFKSKLKQKEVQFLQNLSATQQSKEQKEQLNKMEESIRQSMAELNEREKCITEREIQIDARQKELDAKFARLTQEIDDALYDVRTQYEEKVSTYRKQAKQLEQEKFKCQERIYMLEHKLKDKDAKVRELERKFMDSLSMAAAQRKAAAARATSLTRTTPTPTRKITITRDVAQPMSKSMIETNNTNEPPPPSSSSTSKIRPPSGRTVRTNGNLNNNNNSPELRYNVGGTSAISNTANNNVMSHKSSTTTTTTHTNRNPYIIEKIQKERQELIKKGVSVKDPLIVEIDKRLKNHRLQIGKKL